MLHGHYLNHIYGLCKMYKYLFFLFLVNLLYGQSNTIIGADRITGELAYTLQNKKLAIVSNAVSVCSDGEHVIDKMIKLGMDIKVIFSPEHGFSSAVSAGQKIGNSVYKQTSIPIISLYGELRKPKPEMLQDVDVIVYDLQDVGVRFYTYISTMTNVMQAAANAGKVCTILDRPNPLGGRLVDGPVLDPKFTSFVGIVPIPVAYGLTCGELANMIVAEKMVSGLENLNVNVINMKNYTRDMSFTETGLKWIPPSPNIPDVLTTIVYPGTCLFEATNLSEGRGTNAPFLTIGAPFLDAEKLVNNLKKQNIPGLSFTPVSFTPVSMPEKSLHPKRENQKCNGVKIQVSDPKKVVPFAAGIQILYACKETGGDSVVIRKAGFERLSGVAEIYTMLMDGKKPPEIIESWQAKTSIFKKRSEKYYIYK